MVKRRTFFSFHYKPDNWRAAKVRNMGVVEGNPAVSDNDWEAIIRGGDAAIRNWINGQMAVRSCVVVLIGSHTAGRVDQIRDREGLEGWKRVAGRLHPQPQGPEWRPVNKGC